MARERTRRAKPAVQAKGVSPISGVAPPEHTRFRRGESGNPAGRATNAGSSIKEWINSMAGWPIAKIENTMNDDEAPAAKRAAARVWVDAMSKDRNASGIPIAGGDLDRILDRTLGKPSQSVDMTSEGKGISFAFVTATPADVSADSD